MRIGKKIFWSNMILVVCVLLLTFFSHNYLSERYLLQEAADTLKSEGEAVAQVLEKSLVGSSNFEQYDLKRTFLLRGRSLESKIIVIDKLGEVLYTNLSKEEMLKINAADPDSLFAEYVVAEAQIYNSNSIHLGTVFLYLEKQDVTILNRLMKNSLLLSMLLAVGFVLIMSAFLTKSIILPINKLRNHIKIFSVKSGTMIKVDSKDEVAEIAESFNELSSELQAYDERQTAFFQNASHELKTPLMSIQGYAEAIKDGIVSGEDEKKSLEIIIEESQRLKKLVEKIIYLTKLEQTEENYYFEEMNISAILKKSVAKLELQRGDKKIVLQLPEFMPKSCYDFEKMEQVFLNIIGNGLRYAKHEIKIRVKYFRDASSIKVYIEDDGQGLKVKPPEKVFERFYKGEQGGSGIGLAIAKSIIEGHKGQIRAYNSSSNNGAVFEIELPIDKNCLGKDK